MGILHKYAPLAAILLLVTVSSGCTVPILNIDIPGLPDFPGFGATVVQQEHDVLVIKSMEIVPDTIDSGQTAQVIAYIQNVGDKTVGEKDSEGKDTSVEVDLYDYCQGLYTLRLLTCGSQESYTNQDVTKCSIDKILPGEIVPVIWSVCQNRAEPVKVRTVCPTEGMKMSVRYRYKTTSLTTISLIGLSEMQREMIERRYDTDMGYISLGQGPIKPVLSVEDKQPVPVYDIKPGSANTNPDVINARTVLKLQLQNKGSGQLDSRMPVTTSEGKTREVIAIEGKKITVRGMTVSGETKRESDLTPLAPTKGDEVPCIFSKNSYGQRDQWSGEPVRMIGKESSPYYCKIDLSVLTGKVGMTTSRHLEVDVEYDYLITRSAMITIDPKISA